MSQRDLGTPAPYADLVAGRDPIELLATTPARIAERVKGWDEAQWARSYGVGKWSAAQIVLHLAHDEVGWSNRVRFALTASAYVPQVWDGADWVALEAPTRTDVALDAFRALRRLNVLLYRRLTTAQLERSMPHPEYGSITVGWILRVLAGHDLHHLAHLEAIAAR
jgi:DinB superfamily